MNDQTEFPRVGADGHTVDEEWAVHQLRTTADFAPDNGFATWYFGGLNFQIEHHLFPGISHRHYPALARIVAATARAHGHAYHVYPSWRSALRGHLGNIARHARKNPTPPARASTSQIVS